MAYPDYTTHCDGTFLIFDTAKHNGRDVDPAEVREHVEGCATCAAAGVDPDDAEFDARTYNGDVDVPSDDECACRLAGAAVADRVLAGAEVLKQVYGADFYTRIDTDRLDVQSLCDCVLVQLGKGRSVFGMDSGSLVGLVSFTEMAEEIKCAAVDGVFGYDTADGKVETCCMGFDGGRASETEYDAYSADCAELTAEWKKLITDWRRWSELV